MQLARGKLRAKFCSLRSSAEDEREIARATFACDTRDLAVYRERNNFAACKRKRGPFA